MDISLRELLGWYGVAAILAAYGLSNFSIISIQHPAYIILNLSGSIGLIFDAWHQKNYQPVVLNIVWSAVALISLVKIIV